LKSLAEVFDNLLSFLPWKPFGRRRTTFVLLFVYLTS